MNFQMLNFYNIVNKSGSNDEHFYCKTSGFRWTAEHEHSHCIL